MHFRVAVELGSAMCFSEASGEVGEYFFWQFIFVEFHKGHCLGEGVCCDGICFFTSELFVGGLV